mmetsp:Transcript_89637/g.290026  ORF Transcript_89637/g.290026 Transcript_89637/m.290026 type:complete len:94 (-) Transcript_89637:380-661(-)
MPPTMSVKTMESPSMDPVNWCSIVAGLNFHLTVPLEASSAKTWSAGGNMSRFAGSAKTPGTTTVPLAAAADQWSWGHAPQNFWIHLDCIELVS